MKIINYILRNVNLLNIVLIVIGILLADYAVYPLLKKGSIYNVPAPRELTLEEEEIPMPSVPSITDHMVIVQQNLFHPERRVPTEAKAEDVPMPSPEFILYGTMVTKDVSLAYIADRNAPQTGKRHLTLKKGDLLSGYMLTEIEDDRVVMEKGEEKLIVYLYDPQKMKTREAPSAQQPQVPAPPARRPLPRPLAPNAKPVSPN